MLRKGFRRRWIIVAAAALLYVVLLCATWCLTTRRAARQTESMLDYAMLDLNDTLNGAIDTMLMHVAKSIVEELKQAVPCDQDEMQRIAEQRDVDEINIVRQDGLNLASTDPRLVGISFTEMPQAAEFMVLTKGTREAFSQPFRPGGHNPDVRRKYVGVAFPEGRGFVEVGIDESRLERMFPIIMSFIFDEWLLGEKGWFLCADLRYGRLISNPARHRNEAHFLIETGYDAPGPIKACEDGKTTFRQRLFGEVCDCRAIIFGGHRIIAALPLTEYYATRTLYTIVMGFVLAFVLGLFALLLWRIDVARARIQSFYLAEAEKQAAELELGRTIQMSVLPMEFLDNEYIRLAASMTPAREVGGDFYDFFALDETHQAFLVADVSGKGVTGALYMMNARTLIKDILLTEQSFDPAAALTQANAELCRNNPAEMFITAWVGVLDLENGRVTFANAGHNPPLRLRGRKAPEWLRQLSGCPLACFDNVTYRLCETVLAPGEMLFLYTDGVTEAMNPAGTLYGEARLAATLAQTMDAPPAAVSPQTLNRAVRNDVEHFAEGAPTADDLTVLSVQYLSAVERYMRTFPCDASALEATMEYLSSMLDERGCPTAAKTQLLIALDEVVSNVVRCSGATGIAIEMRFSQAPKGVTIVLSDDGTPFNPLHVPTPDTKGSADERPIGGLGILLLRKTMDNLAYRYAHGCNILTLTKRLDAV